MKTQKEEFDKLFLLSKMYKSLPPIVDDDYPYHRSHYERAMIDFIQALKANRPEEFQQKLSKAELPSLRWKVTIKTPSQRIVGYFEEIEDIQPFVESGPDWTTPNYKITIKYNKSRRSPR